MEDKHSQVVSVMREVPVDHQELIVSPQPHHQAARDESSPREEVSVLPQTKGIYEEECPPTSTFISLEDSWTHPHGVISESNTHSLHLAPSETLREEHLNIDKMDEEGEADTKEGHPSNRLCEEEKAEVKLSKQPCRDINRSEITELTAPSLEERIEPCESKTPDQVLTPLPAVAAHSPEGNHAKEETECTPLIQEMHVGFPPTEAPESLVDLKIQHECTPSIAEESAEVHNLSTIQGSNSGVRNSVVKGDLKEVLNLNTEARNEHLQFEVETEKRVEELDEAKILSVTQKKGSDANVLEELSRITHQDGGERRPGWPSENIPQIQISTIEDTPDIKAAVPEVNQNEHFVIPKIEIMEAELKESTLPLTILALNKPESEPAVSQKHDVTHLSEIIIQEQSMADSPDLLPTQKGMQNDYNLSPTVKAKEIAQLDDEAKMFEQEQPCVKSSEQLPQMDYASIPVINISCTDDSDAFVNAHDSDTPQPLETPTVPLFVVPPISVTCHESDPEPRQLTHNGRTETETSAATQRGTKHDADNNMTTKSEKSHSGKQNFEEVAEKSIKENTHSLLYEALMPKIGNNGPSFNKTTDNNIVPEILKVKPLKEAKIENSMSVEDPQRNRVSVDRLSSKPPAHPSLSPASLRKFMTKVAPDSDNEAVTAVPVITVGDHQGDKADEDLSGGSTPTSSLSCESSPRLKRRDSLTLIRSATPEELASGARRKIFIPKAKEDGEGAVVGALDNQGKKETPYMSPSQARRAALLQAPTGQNTPPMERRSPLLSRRKATLEVPKVVEETPKEEPVTKKEEKPAEKKPDPLKGKESVIQSQKMNFILSCEDIMVCEQAGSSACFPIRPVSTCLNSVISCFMQYLA